LTILDRPLASPLRDPKTRRSVLLKLVVVLGSVLAVTVFVSHLNLSRSLRRLDVGFASGSAEGNYHAIVDDLAALAKKGGGTIRNVASDGSGDNLARLARAGQGGCDVAFGLAQDGSDFSVSDRLRLVARLPKAESVFFLGRDADHVTELSQLAGKSIGIGPDDSGAARIARQIFAMPELKALGATLEPHPLASQLALARSGKLDLAVFVMDEDASMIADAVKDGDLQIAGFAHLDVVARRMPHFRVGRIGAGQYDAVRLLPHDDKRVLRVDTLVVGNGCAGRSETIDLLTILRRRFPDFLRNAKETPNTTLLDVDPAAAGFVEHGGPELADEYVPWLVDVMPPANWAYVVMGVSLLFNAMGAGHRFRLWRIDDARVKLENELTQIFGPSVTLGDISRTRPEDAQTTSLARDKVESLISRLEALAARSRRQSLSVLVPMGQEMAYRYQEEIVYEAIAVLRDYLRRCVSSA
jgi:uncharacterized protein